MRALHTSLHRSFVLLVLLFTIAACGASTDDASPADPTPEPDTPASQTTTRDAGNDATTPAASMADTHPAHERLQQALERYETIAQQGGWPEIPDGDLLEVGDSSDRVIPLRERLAATGDLPEAAASEAAPVYDEPLAEAVRHFQERHGLTVDGILGSNTVAALNVPVEERIQTIELNLERWRTVPDTLGERYVLVNIPEFRLRAYEDGREVERMDVIVGAEYDGRATPVFQDEMEHVIFSPYWNIPQSIAEEEILPEARRDRSYLVENEYEIVSNYGPDAEVYDTYDTDLARVASGELKLRQKPGPENALGLVKFMFPNEYAIYLHGTPEDQLFEEAERDFSHGCIRVERPADLAAFVLSRKSEWTPSRIDQAMHDGEWQQVDLDEHVPVYILYFTAFADEDGTIQFRRDIYGHDEGQPGFDLG